MDYGLAVDCEYVVRAWLSLLSRLGVPEMGTPFSCPRIERRSARPGAKPTTYRSVGFSLEHGNLDWSAEMRTFGKLPSPAMSPMRDGVSVVVRARESRAHGEGRQ